MVTLTSITLHHITKWLWTMACTHTMFTAKLISYIFFFQTLTLKLLYLYIFFALVKQCWALRHKMYERLGCVYSSVKMFPQPAPCLIECISFPDKMLENSSLLQNNKHCFFSHKFYLWFKNAHFWDNCSKRNIVVKTIVTTNHAVCIYEDLQCV